MRQTEEKQKKRPFFTVAGFVTAALCFVAFLVIGLGGYYVSAGEFVSSQLAAVYVVLALAGALAVLLRQFRFAFLYYVGCGLGWAAGWFVAGLKGDFAPTAGTICTFFLIALFSVFGVMAQWKGFQKRRLRKREAKAQAEARAEEELRQSALETARRERETAEAAMLAQAGPAGPEAPVEPAAPELTLTPELTLAPEGEQQAAPAGAEETKG